MPANTPILALPYPVAADTADVPRDIQALAVKLDGMTSLRPPLVTTLPAGPVDGQECYYQNAAMAALGVVWHLRYRAAAAGSYKWEMVGGSALSAAIDTAQTTSATNAYQDLATVGPTLTTPLAGDYIVDFRLQALAPNSQCTPQAGISIGGAAVVGGVDDVGVSLNNLFLNSMARQLLKAGLAAATAIKLQYNPGTTGGVTFSRRSLTLTPTRVG